MKLIIALFIGALLTGCTLELPVFDSASIDEFLPDGRVAQRGLSDFQVKAFNEWLQSHRDGWAFRIEDTAPRLMVALKRHGQTVAVANIREREIKLKDYFRTLTPDERAQLDAILSRVIDTNLKAHFVLP